MRRPRSTDGVPRAVIVTGATSGIGTAIARYIVGRGAAVALLGRNADAGGRLERELGEGGVRASFVPVDVRSEASVERAIDAAWERVGPVDGLVNCAGIQIEKRLHETTIEDWDAVMETNLRGYFLVARQVLRQWLDRGTEGAMVHVSSGLGSVADELLCPYSVSKAGQVLLSHGITVGYGAAGIRSNVVCPGSVANEQFEAWAASTPGGSAKKALLERIHPRRQITTPDEVASVVWTFLTDATRAVSGGVVAIDGGFGVTSQHNLLYAEEATE